MGAGRIIILNGASSSGKTSIVRALQTLAPYPLLDAGLDRFLWMLPKRYLERPLWDDVLGLATEAGETGRALVFGMHRAMASLADAGLHVIADHVLIDPAWVADCAYLFRDLPAYLVGVVCPLNVLEAREAARRDRTLGQAKAQIHLVHAHGIYDLVVDTSRFSPEACAQQIWDQVNLGRRPIAFKTLDQVLNKTGWSSAAEDGQ